MFKEKRKTIQNPISFMGSTMFNKGKTLVKLYPSFENSGIIIKRVDINDKNNVIFANYKSFKSAKNGITLENEDGVSICNVEHIISAIWGAGVDDIIMEVDGPEIPMNGDNADSFLFLLNSASIKNLEKERKVLVLEKDIELCVSDNCYIKAEQSENFIIDMKVVEDNNKYEFRFDNSVFPYEDAVSKIKGCKEEMRNKNDVAKHKILDFIGGLYLAGYYVLGDFYCSNVDSDLASKFLTLVFSNEENYKII